MAKPVSIIPVTNSAKLGQYRKTWPKRRPGFSVLAKFKFFLCKLLIKLSLIKLFRIGPVTGPGPRTLANTADLGPVVGWLC